MEIVEKLLKSGPGPAVLVGFINLARRGKSIFECEPAHSDWASDLLAIAAAKQRSGLSLFRGGQRVKLAEFGVTPKCKPYEFLYDSFDRKQLEIPAVQAPLRHAVMTPGRIGAVESADAAVQRVLDVLCPDLLEAIDIRDAVEDIAGFDVSEQFVQEQVDIRAERIAVLPHESKALDLLRICFFGKFLTTDTSAAFLTAPAQKEFIEALFQLCEGEDLELANWWFPRPQDLFPTVDLTSPFGQHLVKIAALSCPLRNGIEPPDEEEVRQAVSNIVAPLCVPPEFFDLVQEHIGCY